MVNKLALALLLDFVFALFSRYQNWHLHISDSLNSLWTEWTPQTPCSLTVSDQHLDEAAGSTSCPGQELPQLLCNHQNQKHGGSVWCLNSYPPRILLKWDEAGGTGQVTWKIFFWKTIFKQWSVLDLCVNLSETKRYTSSGKSLWCKSLVFERLCAIQVRGHVKAANVWEKAPVTRTGSCVLAEGTRSLLPQI